MEKLRLYNTLKRRKEVFVPLKPPKVGMYTCGPTVYDYPHIGNWRSFVFADILRRTLGYNGYQVKQVMNITDVGHLTGDADFGEDKLEKGARREKKTVWEIARFYEKNFLQGLEKLNILKPHVLPRATEHIKSMIAVIKLLEEKGFTYETAQALYFDTSRFPDYGRLSSQPLADKRVGARPEVAVDPQKRHPADFVLWFKRVGRFAHHVLHWSSPWGEGFPGWHIECSAMSMRYLGKSFDIHTGGVDHIAVHHSNEIAQSEGATGRKFVNYWLHGEFLLISGKKISKSLRNFFTLEDLEKRGFSPLDLRYLFLTAHYRQKMNFSWRSLQGAKKARQKLAGLLRLARSRLSGESPASVLRTPKGALRPSVSSSRSLAQPEAFRQRFSNAINNDLNIPQALGVVWEVVKSKLASEDKYELVRDFDKVLGLRLGEIEEVRRERYCEVERLPKKVRELVKRRENLRKEKRWEEADEIREEIWKMGYKLEDTKEGTKVIPNTNNPMK